MVSKFEAEARRYLTRFQNAVENAKRAGSCSVEMATRPVVHDFLENLVRLCEPTPQCCVVHHDTTATKTDRPDWRLEDRETFGVFAYGDHKSLNSVGEYRFNASERRQICRYLELERPVFIFDGIEIVFFTPEAANPFREAVRYELIPKTTLARSKWSREMINPSFETSFRKLLNTPGFRKWTEADLVTQLARRARLIADVVTDLIRAPADSARDSAEAGLITAIHDLHDQLAKHYDPALAGEDSCADFVAQSLVFGLFYAHTQASEVVGTVEERRGVIKTFWSDTRNRSAALNLRTFHTISNILHDTLSAENDLRVWYDDVINLLAHAEYQGRKSEARDFHALFEQFQSAFNPKARFDYGAWYTPKELTLWTVAFCNKISTREFGSSLVESVDKVIDPCVGTGGFLEAFIQHFSDAKPLALKLVGLEILPAPYALAQYRLSTVARGTAFEDKIELFLTDTLADQIYNPPEQDSSRFAPDLIMASSSARPPIRLVLGNPPSTLSAKSQASRTIIDQLMEDFRPPKDVRGARQNIQKALNNEAYRFLRWSAARVLAAEQGILALIVPGSFIRSVSLRYAREWLKQQFQMIWILELDDDARNGEPTESLFRVQQGRAAIIAVRKPNSATSVYFHSIARRPIAGKKSYLLSEPNLSEFQRVDGEHGEFTMKTEKYPTDIWDACWPLTPTKNVAGIFRSKCSGVKLAPTSVLFHTDKSIMTRRSADIGKISDDWQSIAHSWFSGQQRPPLAEKMTNAVRKEVAEAIQRRPAAVVRYSYRPFVEGYALLDHTVMNTLADAKGGGTRSRPELQAAFAAGAAALCIAPSPRDLGASLNRIASFAWHVADNDNVARGNAMVYPNKFPTNLTDQDSKYESVETNLSDDAEKLLGDIDQSGKGALYYVYAVMSSAAYLKFFEPVLYVSADPSEPFRVPLAHDAKIRAKLAQLGRQIAEKESSSHQVKVHDTLQARWPDGVAGFKLKKFFVDPSAGQILLRNEEGESIVSVEGVTARCLSETICGHPVVSKWLRERQYAYIRREFREQDLRDLLGLVSRMQEQHVLLDQVDRILGPLLADRASIAMPPKIATYVSL
jgi:hypothetical protein